MSETPSNCVIRSVERKQIAWKRSASVAIVLSLFLGACATDSASRNTGERLSDRGSEIGAYGTAWSEGQNNVQMAEAAIEKSDRRLAKAERDFEQARAELAKAERQISDASATKTEAMRRIEDGKAQMARAEADYATTKAGPSAVHPNY